MEYWIDSVFWCFSYVINSLNPSLRNRFIDFIFYLVAATWTVMNTLSIIVGLIFTFPFLVLALFLAFITTFIINMGRLTMISGKYVYQATLMFFRCLFRSDIGQGSTEGEEDTSRTANHDAVITSTMYDTVDTL